jgi:hypothetical protein
VPVFAATEYATVPDPEPLPPDVMVIHEAELDAVHAHPLVVVTLTVPVNVCPAIVSDPVRWVDVEFAATE